jgi:hypothetical protein
MTAEKSYVDSGSGFGNCNTVNGEWRREEMNPSPEISKRITDLTHDLDQDINRTLRNARLNYTSSVLLMLIALGCSLGAGCVGLIARIPRHLGVLAFLPPLIALVATTLKLDGKARWHCKKLNGLEVLRSRLLYELPDPPSVDNVAAVANSWTHLNETMEEEWNQSLDFDWSVLAKKPPANAAS